MTTIFIIAAAVAVLVIVGTLVVLKNLSGAGDIDDASPYQKKKFLFDTTGEFNLYKILLEIYGDRYRIFPQINYSHVVEVKKMDWKEERRYRSRIDRKSADFVLCDKEHAVPLLIIELDGSVHYLPNKRRRDEFIDDITKVVGLPILHLKSAGLDKDLVRAAVDGAMAASASSSPKASA